MLLMLTLLLRQLRRLRWHYLLLRMLLAMRLFRLLYC